MFEKCQAKEIRQTMQSEIFVNWIISYHLPSVYCAGSKISDLQDVIALYTQNGLGLKSWVLS